MLVLAAGAQIPVCCGGQSNDYKWLSLLAAYGLSYTLESAKSSQCPVRAARADYVTNGRKIIPPLQATSGGSFRTY